MHLVSLLDAKMHTARDEHTPRSTPALKTLADLTAEVDKLPGWTTRFVNPETFEWAFAVIRCPDQPEEIAKATNILTRAMGLAITAFMAGAGDKPLIWRKKPEIYVWRGDIIEYRDDGPDTCNITDRKCVRDWSTVNVKIYARFGIDDLPKGAKVPIVKGDPIPVGYSFHEEITRDNCIICVKD